MIFFLNTNSQVMTLQSSVGSALMALNGEDDNELGTTAVKKLVETLDEYIPEPERAIDQVHFLCQSKTYSRFQGRGTVVTGRVERGIITVGDEIEIVGIKETTNNYLYWC